RRPAWVTFFSSRSTSSVLSKLRSKFLRSSIYSIVPSSPHGVMNRGNPLRMTGLGYDRLGAQGGDIGAGVSMWLGRHGARQEHLAGRHVGYGETPVSPTTRSRRLAGESLVGEVGVFRKACSSFDSWPDPT